MAERRLTILQLLPSLISGGVERGTLEVSRAICQRGWRSLVMSAGGPMVTQLAEHGAEHTIADIGAKTPWVFRHILTLRKHIQRFNVDIVHARSRLPAWLAIVALRGVNRQHRPALITTVHGLNSVNRYSEVMTRGDAVITVSKACQAYVLKHYPRCDPRRLHCVPRGVDPDYFHYGWRPQTPWLACFRRRYPATLDGKIITLLGRITQRKGAGVLLRLVSSLNRQGTPSCGLIVGGAAAHHHKHLDDLHRQAAELGVSDRVVFTGPRDDVREIMSISDLVLSLSAKPESFGRSVLEALSLGRPVAGWAHGGVAEIMASLYPAGAVTPGDEAALAKCAQKLLTDPPAVPRRHGYTRARMLDSTLALYESVLASRL